jgi:hypothetical protein
MNELVGSTFYDGIDNPMEAIEKMGNWMVRSGLFGMDRAEQGCVMAMACLCERKNPLEIARQFHIVENKLSKKYETMIAEFHQVGGKIIWLTRDKEACEAKFIHPQNGEFQLRIDMAELKESGVALTNAGKVKTNYLRYPRQMLTARVVSEAMRIICPGIVCGIYTPEEISDFDGVKVNPLDGSSMSEAPSLLQKEEKPKAKRTRKPKVEEVKEVVAEVVKEEAPEVKETAPTAKKEAVTETPEPPAEDNVPDNSEVVKFHPEVLAKLEPIADAVNKYLFSLGWLDEGQTFHDVEPARAAQITGHLDTFLARIEGDK